MSHILKYSEWESESGWHCNDLEDLAHGSAKWWLPARMMNLTPAAYLEWVIKNYKPDTIKYSDDCSLVYWSWKSQVAMRKFKNDMNAMARKSGYMIC